MKTGLDRINTYLLAAAAAVAAFAWLSGAGCSTAQKEKMEEASLRLHMQANPDRSAQGNTTNAIIGRVTPFEVTIERLPFLTEFNIERADVADSVAGFSIAVQFTPEGTITLEQYTTAYKGQKMVIGAEFGQTRWLAAPVIRQRIADGKLVFTPDATREEAERIVRGLNRVAYLVKNGRK